MCKTNYELIINHTGIGAFDVFNAKYSEKALEICSQLAAFQIHIVHHYDTPFSDDMGDNDAAGYYIEPKSKDTSRRYAEIIINFAVCERFCLTDAELLAAAAHEVGHVIFYFLTDKEFFQGGNAEEMLCDDYACRMGLKDEMVSLLNKMIASGEYEQEQNDNFRQRIEYILLE